MNQLTAKQMSQVPIKIRTLLSRHGIQQREIIVVRSDQSLAYTIGIWSSKIVLSSALISRLSLLEIEAVLLHERYHQRYAHAVLFSIGEIANSILFVLPILDDILSSMKLQLEIEADRAVVAYQKTTRHLLTSLQAVTALPVARYYPGFATYRLEDRVGLLKDRLPQSRPFSLHKITVSIVVMLVSFVVIQIPVSADTSLNSQLGQKCEGSLVCAETCPAVEKSSATNVPQKGKALKSSASFPMSYGH